MTVHDAVQETLSRHSDFAYCEQIIRKSSQSFYSAFSLLPRFKAQCVFAIYAFCRGADDAVDRHLSAPRLDDLEAKLCALFSDGAPDGPVFRALQAVREVFPLEKQPFLDMIAGQRRDLNFTQPRNQEELDRYCYEVAGSVGLMLLPVLSARTAELKQAAVGLGTAMQLTNILRDVGEDERMGRIYFPESAMAEAGYSAENLKRGVIDSAFLRLWESQAERAERLYDAFEAKSGLLDDDARPATLAALRLYRGILNAVRNNNYRCFDRRAYLAADERSRILRQLLPQMPDADEEEALV